jgi:hypothetical protein
VKDFCNSGWTATSDDPWLKITSGDSGSGGGTVKYKVEKNPSTSLRTGSITVAGQTFTVEQEEMKDSAEPKIRVIDSGGVTVDSVADKKQNSSIALKPSDALSISVSITAGKDKGVLADWWLVISTPFGWAYLSTEGWKPGLSVTYQGPLNDVGLTEILNLPGGVLPEGRYTFYFAVDVGPGKLHYEFVTAEIIKIGDDDSCEISISVPSKSFGFTRDTGSFTVNDPCNKGWMVTSNSSWISITSGNSGTGNGKVQYEVNYSHNRAANRTGGITVTDEKFKVEQLKNTSTDE